MTARYTGVGTSPLMAGGGINTMMVTEKGQMLLPPGKEFAPGSADVAAKMQAMNMGAIGGPNPGLPWKDVRTPLPRQLAGGWPADIYHDTRNWAGTAVSSSVSGAGNTYQVPLSG